MILNIKYKIRSLLFILITVLISSCAYFPNKSGVYVFEDTINTFDTLKLYQDGNYKHIIYYKYYDTTVLNKGKWKHEGDRIVLVDYFPNEGNKFPPDTSWNRMEEYLFVQFYSGSMFSNKLIVNFDLEIYYDKIENY